MLIRFYAIRFLVVLALACTHLGCAKMLENTAREALPGVVAGTVEGLADPETQRQMVEAVDEGRVKEASSRLSAGIIDGMLATLEEPTRRERLEAIVSGLTAKAAGSVVDAMLARVLDAKVQGRIRLAMRVTVADLITAIFETVDSQMGSPEDRNHAIAATVHGIAKQATLGFQDALDDTRRDRLSGAMPKADGALIIAANNASQAGYNIVWTLGLGLAAVAFGFVITLIWSVRKNRQRRAELEQRDSALRLLTEAITSTAARPGADELHAALKTAIRDRIGGAHIRKALGEQGLSLLGIDKLS